MRVADEMMKKREKRNTIKVDMSKRTDGERGTATSLDIAQSKYYTKTRRSVGEQREG